MELDRVAGGEKLVIFVKTSFALAEVGKAFDKLYALNPFD
jgi:hypothetical protein